MAAVAPPADQASDLLQKLSLDSQAKSIEAPDVSKKPSIDSNNVANGVQSDRSVTPILPDFVDPNMCYLQNGYSSPAFYYGGYDGSGTEWEEYARYVNQDGVDVTPGVYGDNGSLMYHHGYGYAPYAPYSPATTPVPTLGHDGQLYGAQHYQYPAPYFQTMTPTSAPYSTPSAPTKAETATSTPVDQIPLHVDSTNSKSGGLPNNNGGAKGNHGVQTARGTNQSSSVNATGSYGKGLLPGGIAVSGYQEPRFGYDGLQSPIPWLEGAYFSDGQPRPATNSTITNGSASRARNYRPHPMGLHHPSAMSGMNNGYINRMYPNKLYGQYGNAYRYGMGYESNGYDRLSGRGWTAVDGKYKQRGRGNGLYNYGIESMDGLNELNRGPRTKSNKNQKGFTPVALAVNGHTIPLTGTTESEEKSNVTTPDREQYNRTDFPETYSAAKFFIIKSYSEDDVHKSIKYNVWSSTPNGNKKLDAAYLDAQQNPGNCPVFLFFSVNTSGQFIGVAEMTGPVDFNKNVEYWQQDKWVGCFPVKWHIVKDVPNSLLKHIILENNENKPVTNSRDTQEVKLEQGLQLIKIFKDHASKQCILDDFDFYEERQRRIQEKKAKQQQFQKHARVWESRPAEDKKENTNNDLKTQKSPEVVSDLNSLAAATPPVEMKENCLGSEAKDTPNGVKSENLVANGVANGC